MKMIKRTIREEIQKSAKKYPIVTITGPRQSGKTTLAKQCFPEKEYISLEDTDIRALAIEDPRGFLNKIPKGAILDEIQRAPDLLSYIQTIVDSKQQNGMFILTGSNQFSLIEKINQSLAGRVRMLKLLPFNIKETKEFSKNYSINDYLYRGFYPGIYSQNRDPVKSYSDYYETYIERDVRQLINIKDLSLFRKFLKLCAGRTGQIFNASTLSNETGVSVNTIRSWISILEASYILYLLPPWFDNISKRLIKSPKMYFYDTGLAAYLIGIRKKEHLETHPIKGNLFENMVIGEILKGMFNSGLEPDLFFYRDKHQNEVDIILPDGHEIIPIEIKSAETFHGSFLRSTTLLKKIYENRIKDSYIIYAGKAEQKINNVSLINYKNTISCLLK